MPFSSTYLQRQPTATLLRSLLVFRLCRVPLLIKNARPLLAALQAVPAVGPPLARALLRGTFFAQFVGGETEAELAPVVAALAREGVGSILDYAAEADEAPPAGGGGGGAAAAAAREAHSQACLRLSLQSVAAAASTGGFAAVKVTGIADPAVLKAVTQCMRAHRLAFDALAPAGSACSEGVELVAPTLQLSQEAFLAALAARAPPGTPRRALQRRGARCDARGAGAVDYLAFCDAARLLGLGRPELAQAAAEACGLASPGDALALLLGSSSSGGGGGALAQAQRSEWNAGLARLAQLCAAAQASGVSLMVDAEQTYLQGAIDLAVITMQRHFNPPASASGGASAAAPRPPAASAASGTALPLLPEELHALALARGGGGGGEPGAPAAPPAATAAAAAAAAAPAPAAPTPAPIIPVFNTYQAYLRETPSRLALGLARAEREGWALGVKLVRGAYMAQERARAAEQGYADPIWRDIGGTHEAYAACVAQLLGAAKSGHGAFMVASHNTASCLGAAAEVEAWGGGGAGGEALLLRARRPGGVSFGQLLGMSDALTFSLAARGLPVFKYMPYGPLEEVTPYLLRRGEENSDLLTSNVAGEILSLQAELRARAFGRPRA